MAAAAWGLHAGDRRQALRALIPIAAGHAASIACVAAAIAFTPAMDRALLPAMAGGLLVVLVLMHGLHRRRGRTSRPALHAGLALWSFIAASAHGAGLMLVPALMPLCTDIAPGRAIDAWYPLLPALAAVGVHTVAMLSVTALVAATSCRGIEAAKGRPRGVGSL